MRLFMILLLLSSPLPDSSGSYAGSNVNKTYTVTGVLVGLGVVGFFAFLFFAVLVGDVVVTLF